MMAVRGKKKNRIAQGSVLVLGCTQNTRSQSLIGRGLVALPDMTAQVFFEIDAVRDAPIVPANAVSAGREGGSIVRELADGCPQPCPMEAGLRDRDKTQILSGLQEGETVIVPDALAANEAQGGGRGRLGMDGLLGAGGRRQ